MIDKLKHRLHKNRYKARFEMLEQLLHNQTLTRTQLLDKQRRDLAGIVAHAVAHTDYYRTKYGDLVADNDNGPDVSRLPILRKDEVINHKEALLANTIDRNDLRTGYTGGSTGKPLAFYYDRHKMELMRAGMCRSYMWSGWRPGQKILNFWGAKQDLKGGGLRKRYGDFIAAEKTIGAYEYTEPQLNDWAKAITSYRPVLLQGYASVLAELASHVIEHKMPMPNTLQGVFSTAEVLYDRQRELIETAFACKVFNQYGSREIPNMACECRHGNYHIFTDMVYIESINAHDEDRLIVTSLTNRVMPFIRYAIGDSGKLKEGDCPCGSPFPMMEMGLCRSNDIIRTKTGKRIYPAYFIHLLDGLTGIRQYQFVQSELEKITLNIKAPIPLEPAILRSIERRIQKDIEQDMIVEINRVDEIKRTASGKHRFVISDIAAS